MNARWSFVGVASLVAIVAVAVGVARTRTKDPSLSSISAEPTAPPVAVENAEQPSNAGVALPLEALPSSQPTRHSKPQHTAPLPLDMIEPWTGEDLTPVVVAARSARLTFERIDPWDPSLIHDVSPTLPTDDTDPWNEVVSMKKRSAPPKAQLAFDKTSPWAEGTSSPVTSL